MSDTPTDDRIFAGKRATTGQRRVDVTLDGEPLPLCLELRNHSPTGFEWVYGGSGPSQLALAMLCACTDEDTAQREYHNFKWACVSRIDAAEWILPVQDVLDWLQQRRNGGVDDNTSVNVRNMSPGA